MNIVVCIKQVPDTKGGVKFNADGTLDRAAMLAIMNLFNTYYDIHVLFISFSSIFVIQLYDYLNNDPEITIR